MEDPIITHQVAKPRSTRTQRCPLCECRVSVDQFELAQYGKWPNQVTDQVCKACIQELGLAVIVAIPSKAEKAYGFREQNVTALRPKLKDD